MNTQEEILKRLNELRRIDQLLRIVENYRVALQTIEYRAKEIEQHCPCGARPESLNTHPHVTACPVWAILLSIDLAKLHDQQNGPKTT